MLEQGSVDISGDKFLLLQLSEGNRQAFDALYDRYFSYVYNAAYKRINNDSHAQDIAQEVFVQLWMRGSKVPIENLSAYLFTLVRNNVYQFLKKEARYTSLPEVFPETEDPHVTADGLLLYEEFEKSFDKLLLRLSPQQRLIFKMKYEKDMSSIEIAESLGVSVKTVRNQLGKALARLKSSFLLVLICLLHANS